MSPSNELSVNSGETDGQTSRSRAIRQPNRSRNHGGDACIRADSRLAFDMEHSVGLDMLSRVCNDYFSIVSVYETLG